MTRIYFSILSFNFIPRSFNLVTRSFRFGFGCCLIHDRLDMTTIYFLILLHDRLIWLSLNLVTRSFRFEPKSKHFFSKFRTRSFRPG